MNSKIPSISNRFSKGLLVCANSLFCDLQDLLQLSKNGLSPFPVAGFGWTVIFLRIMSSIFCVQYVSRQISMRLSMY